MSNRQRESHASHGTGHEANVVSSRGVLLATLALAALLVAALLAMRVLFGLFSGQTSPPEEYWKPPTTAPPNPDQAAQLRDLRAAEEGLLNEYSWVDEQNGVARIPIERAKELLLHEGLPARPRSEEAP